MVSKRNIAGLMSSLLIAGCTVGPDYSRPSSALPDRYLTTDSGTSAVQNPDPTSLAAWWITFKDPILNQLIEQTLEQNLELEQARARISQVEAGSDYATATLLPSGNASAQVSHNFYKATSFIPTLKDNLAREMNLVDVLLGAPPGTCSIMLSQPQCIPAKHKLNDIDSPATLLTLWSDIISADQRLDAINADIGSAIAEYYPKFSISELIGISTFV